jgi:GntR family transcriptional repressor for pyruvate dehydrogenase complex
MIYLLDKRLFFGISVPEEGHQCAATPLLRANIGEKKGIRMQIETIRADSAPEKVVKQILKNLETGDMRPGEQLPTQEKLAEIFGVGRSSIREATNALAIMGYLKIIQGKGTFISEKLPSESPPGTSEKDFFRDANLFNLLEIREVLECHAVEKAAERADSRQLALLGKAIKNLEASVIEREKFLAADLNFHISIANAANLPEVGRIVRVIHHEINKLLAVVFTTSKPEAVLEAIETAKSAYTFIIGGEGKQAARCMRNHLDTSRKALRKIAQPNA